MKKIVAFLAAASLMAGMMPMASAANENWRSPFITRLMKVLSQDPSYTDVVLTDLDRNGIPEAFVVRRGTYGGIGSGFTMVNNVITDIDTPSNIIGECLENIDVYIKNDAYIFVGQEVSRYTSNISFYKLTLDNNKLTATRINKKDVSPYAHVTYVDKWTRNVLDNGYPNRAKVQDFIESYDVVNNLSATLSTANILINGTPASVGGYSVNDTNFFKIRDIAMLLRNTPSKFNVTWDEANQAISITPGEDYTVIGGELVSDVPESIEVVENDTPIFVNGRQTAITAYNINGSSYFKIRDIADAVGFNIEWDGATQTINIVTY